MRLAHLRPVKLLRVSDLKFTTRLLTVRFNAYAILLLTPDPPLLAATARLRVVDSSPLSTPSQE